MLSLAVSHALAQSIHRRTWTTKTGISEASEASSYPECRSRVLSKKPECNRLVKEPAHIDAAGAAAMPGTSMVLERCMSAAVPLAFRILCHILDLAKESCFIAGLFTPMSTHQVVPWHSCIQAYPHRNYKQNPSRHSKTSRQRRRLALIPTTSQVVHESPCHRTQQ